MLLLFASGRRVVPARPADLAAVPREEFAILCQEEDSEVYMQCRRPDDGGDDWLLEHRAGSAEEHYAAIDEPLTWQQVQSAMIHYLAGDDAWRTTLTWEKLDLD